jgi:hypothetical protein
MLYCSRVAGNFERKKKMAILILHIKKKWFDLILNGEKKEEYREIKPFWSKRLCHSWDVAGVRWSHQKERWDYKDFDEIEFRNGYGKASPRFRVKYNGLDVGPAQPEHGGELFDEDVFRLKLGEIVSFHFISEPAPPTGA